MDVYICNNIIFKMGIMDWLQIISIRHWSAILAAWVNGVPIKHPYLTK